MTYWQAVATARRKRGDRGKGSSAKNDAAMAKIAVDAAAVVENICWQRDNISGFMGPASCSLQDRVRCQQMTRAMASLAAPGPPLPLPPLPAAARRVRSASAGAVLAY